MKKIFFASLIIALLVPLFSSAQINVSTNLVIPTVELVWEAHSYLPPLYRGKALYPVSGEITVYAFPPAEMGDPSNLTYTWKRDGVVQGDLSGAGRRSYTFSGSRFGDTPFVVVEISDGKRRATGAIRIQQTTPFVRFYENTVLGGIALEHALTRDTVPVDESFTVEAYPFFFSGTSRSNTHLSYNWSVNGQHDANIRVGSVLLQTDEPRTVYLQLSLNNTVEILQRAVESVSITFE